MLENALRQLHEQDAFAAVAILAVHDDHAAALDTASDLVKKLFNELKNVPAMLVIGLGAVHLGLHWAALESDAARFLWGRLRRRAAYLVCESFGVVRIAAHQRLTGYSIG